MEKRRSLEINMLLNVFRGIIVIIMPLITFPYVSRILGVESIGKVNFVHSIIAYFILLADLGIRMYTVGQGPKYRDDKKKLERFVNSIFTINLISTVVSYILLWSIYLAVPKFHYYKTLFIIMSFQIILKTIGVEWLYSIFEDFLYITLRTIIVNITYVFLLFIFVKSPSDLFIYAILITVSQYGSNLFNYIHSRKYLKLHITKELDLNKHLKPIMLLFATQATITIYVSSDTTILGFLCGDSAVGIYSVSVKVYTIIKNIVASVVAVSIPRLAACIGENNKKAFNSVAEETYKILVTILLPTICGIVFMSKNIVLIISGISFIAATTSLSILSVAMFFCVGAYFWGQAILIPVGREKVLFQATIISAISNVILNFLLIPLWQEKAAALTTLIAEGIAFVWCAIEGKKYVEIKGIGKTIAKTIVGCFGIAICVFIIKTQRWSLFAETLIAITSSVLTYFVIEILLKNDVIYSVIKAVLKKFGIITKHREKEKRG